MFKTNIMKYYLNFTFLLLIISAISCTNKKEIVEVPKEIPFAIVIHGGAGYIVKDNMSAEKQKMYNDALKNALDSGYKILEDGGNSLDAVQYTITILEDSPLFNAGKGAVYDNQGKNKMDASIMDGNTLNTGAVAGVSNIKNPILLARMVMDSTKHVLLSGKGAEVFAEQFHLKFENDAYFYTKRQHDYLLKVQKRERDAKLKKAISKSETKTSNIQIPSLENSKYGTVGAVALDKNGNIAAGTSTGGLTNKKYGRIGDSPIIGAGTYANNTTCGVSCTGTGEYFIRTLAAHEVSNLIQYKKLSAKNAVKDVIHTQITNLGGKGGIIVLDKLGNIAWDFNTKGMFRGYKKSTGENEIGFFEMIK